MNMSHGGRAFRRWVGALAAAVVCLAFVSASATARPLRNCRPVDIPVALQPVQPETQHIWGELCLPAGARPDTVQLLVHGGTYNHRYWDFGVVDGTDYSYVDAALHAGYAVLDIDRLGAGQSSHPPSTALTFPTTIFTLHQVVQDLRSGTLGAAFGRVLYVGHSYGSAYGVDEAATYGDVDGLILTGYGHKLSPSFAAQANAEQYPAIDDPLFAGSGLDPGYWTSVPGTRAALYYYTPTADPRVIALDEASKDLISATEKATRPNTALLTPGIHVPVLILDGDHDIHYCATDADDCSTQAGFYAQESPYFSAAACLATVLIPRTGHDTTLHRTAPLGDAAMLYWSYLHLRPDGGGSPCTGAGPLFGSLGTGAVTRSVN